MVEQRIAKTTRKVQVTLLNGQQLSGEVFLSLYGTHHAGQRLGELLNGEDDFIPFKTAETVSILNTAQILMVKTEATEELDELMTLGKRYSIQVATPHHRKMLQAEVYVNLPAETSRVRDWLNQPIDFLCLFLADDIIYLNRKQIISVQD
jgi:hypothetical protein